MNLRPSGYEPDELPGCSTPRQGKRAVGGGQRAVGKKEFGDCLLPTADCRLALWKGLTDCKEEANVLGGPGDDLLSRVLRQSTIGAEAFDGRVRDGIGSDRLAEGHQAGEERWLKQNWIFVLMSSSRFGDESDQAERAISTGQLHALLRVHIRPIDVVVFHGSSGRTGFEAGFPLRCLQRLSIPHIATLHCDWRHNRSTRDVFTPVLSY